MEQLADESGIVWPKAIAPFDVHVVLIGDPGTPPAEFADRLYEELTDGGLDVLYDDRAGLSPGQKFVEAELLGCPVRVTVGKRTLPDGPLEVQIRRGREKREVPHRRGRDRHPRAVGRALIKWIVIGLLVAGTFGVFWTAPWKDDVERVDPATSQQKLDTARATLGVLDSATGGDCKKVGQTAPGNVRDAVDTIAAEAKRTPQRQGPRRLGRIPLNRR